MAEDGEVEVDEEGRVGVGFGRMRLGGEDQRADLRGELAGNSRVGEGAGGEGGAFGFVTGRTGIVDGVVKPEGGFDGEGLNGEGARGVELRETFVEVAPVVVEAVGLSVGGGEQAKGGRRIAARAEGVSEISPTLRRRVIHAAR